MARVSPSGKENSTETFTLFGFPQPPPGAKPAKQTGPVNSTSTHTTVELEAGDVTFTLDFLSPVSPNNYVRHSFPFSYLTVSADVSDDYDISIFSAIDDTWLGEPTTVNTNLLKHNDTSVFTISDPNQKVYAEVEDMAAWGSAVYAAQSANASSLSSQCGRPSTLHDSFIKFGVIGTKTPEKQCRKRDEVAHLQTIQKCSGTCSVSFAIGHYREWAVNYLGQPQTPYCRSDYHDIQTMADAFLDDYDAALQESKSLDNTVRTHGDTISKHYTDILEISVRQTFAAHELTIPLETLSTDPKSVNVFLKEISSDGDVQTVDVLYESFPLLLLLCPEWIAMQLQPILEYVLHPPPTWPKPWTPHDLGFYPNATGHNDGYEEQMPVENTGQILCMLLLHAIATGDFDFSRRYTGQIGKFILENWADYLVTHGQHPDAQLAAVDIIRPILANQTQLAMQAALGVSAFGALSGGRNYTDHGAEMTQQLLTNSSLGAMDKAKTHFTYTFRDDKSWSNMFPLYTDFLLHLPSENSFASAYKMQSDWYDAHISPLGLAYKNNEDFALTDYNLMAAAYVESNVREKLIESTWSYLTSGRGSKPFMTKYIVEGHRPDRGVPKANTARSTVGSNFAVLTVNSTGRWKY